LSWTVVALGGHLLAQGGGDVAEALRPLGAPLAITHGNGPQVGEELIRAPGTPIHIAVARTQGELGSRIAGELGAVAVITHVRVGEDDSAFERPTKPIGPWLPEEPAGPSIHDPERGWRRVVASPRPREIVELEQIRALLASGASVVCCGGGGIPLGSDGGVDAVIDKDRASALLAASLYSPRLVVLTDVDAVYRDFRTPAERSLEALTAEEAEALLPELPEGSMRPKLEACAAFVRATGGEALVTSPEALAEALAGRAGTRVAP
jgi:carbamate kinase